MGRRGGAGAEAEAATGAETVLAALALEGGDGGEGGEGEERAVGEALSLTGVSQAANRPSAAHTAPAKEAFFHRIDMPPPI